MSVRVTFGPKRFLAGLLVLTAAFGSIQAATGRAKPLSRSHAKPAVATIADGTPASAADVKPRVVQQHLKASALATPANDECIDAIAIPAGPFPISAAPVDITDATPQDTDEGILTCAPIDRTIWYSFTPSQSGQYIFSTCADNGAGGNTVYDTVIGVLDACPGSPNELGCNDSTALCAGSLPGAPYVDQSVLSVVLAANTTYYIAVGHFADDLGGVVPTLNTVSLQVDLSPAPDNDNCSNPAPLALDRITFGTTASATNDYRSIGCPQTDNGQIPTTANGLDVVFSFSPPTDGRYSFRYVQDDASAALRTQSPVLYLATTCPDPDPTVGVPGCIAAANRMNDQTTGNGNRSEELDCLSLTANTPYYLFFDDRFTANPGGPFAVEVTRCNPETEPNDTTANATVFAPSSGCYMEGAATPTGVAGDVDFYDLGAPPAGSKIFVAIDAAAANNSDYQMRITNATDTLGFDDDDGTSIIGSNAPVIGGVIADGSEIYARVNGKPTLLGGSGGDQPYRLFARIEQGPAEGPSQPDPNPDGLGDDTIYEANHITLGGFIKGVIYSWDTTNGPADIDCWRFVAHEGDNITMFSDNNPTRAPGTITNVWPVIETVDGNPPAHTRFVGQVLRNTLTPSPGTLTGTTPSVTSEFHHYRARYTGWYAVCMQPTVDTGTPENPPPAAYPLPYQASIAINCGPVPAPQPADVSITQAGPAGPVQDGSLIEYTITVTNNDATAIAQDVRLTDTLPPEVVFVGVSVDDGFAGGNTACLSLPTPGANDADVDCTNYSLAPGASITYTLTVQVQNCQGPGLTVHNDTSITTYTTDANAANDSASWEFVTVDDGTCTPTLCDPSAGCIVDHCQVNAACDASHNCAGTPLNCDDGSVCTADSCDPSNAEHPCVNDPSQLGDLCFDGNVCTIDSCDPIAFCVFTPTPAGSPCDDFLSCTHDDVCNGTGTCYGVSVCDDGLPCTDDFADENNACACTNTVSFQGTPCDDGNSCTTGETCDGTGGTVAACTGGTPVEGACNDGNSCTSGEFCTSGVCGGGEPVVCNDNNPCTDDSCDPASGCVFTNNNASCSDGNACTTGDTCAAGVCVGGAPLSCDDGNACTDDSCAPATGCVHSNNSNVCDDGNACTLGEICSGGTCGGGEVVDCNDGDTCTTDSCSPATGCAHVPVVCTGDTCHTAGTCDPATGQCLNPAKPQGTACDDNNVCTTGETCNAGGVCTGGAAVDCDDANACTADSCDAVHGCANALANFSTSGFSADRVDGRDLEVFAAAYPRCQGAPAYDPAADLDSTGCVDDTDFHLFMTTFGQGCP